MNSIDSLKSLPFFYILSIGRSGSTLLELLLDAHPNVNIPIESRFIIHLYYKYGSKKQWSDSDKKRFIDDLFLDYMIKNFWNINKEKLSKEILETELDVSFFDLCRIITSNYISFYPKNEISIQGSKNPNYSLWGDVLYAINKQSKFIHLVRNPMGVVASQKKLKHKNLYYYAYRWNLVNRRIEKIKSQTPENFITIKYEDLLSNSEETLKKICKFLNIDFMPQQLYFYEKIIEHRDKIEKNNDTESIKIFESHLKNLVYPIKPNNSEKWKETLSKKEIKDIAYITKSIALKYNYKLAKYSGGYKLIFLFAYIKNQYKFIRNRMYYKFSLSLK